MGIYRAVAVQRPPKRPQQLAGSDTRAAPMWNMLLKCWDHDPSARLDAESVFTLVSKIGELSNCCTCDNGANMIA